MSSSQESAFRSSLRGFQAGSSSGATDSSPSALFNKINPQKWLQSVRGGDDGTSEGLLSGVRNLTNNNSNSSAFSLSTYQRFMAFLCCTAGGIICFTLSFMTLPLIVLSPHKFAFLSCMGSILIFSSIGFLRGWGGHIKSVFGKERWPFTVGYLGSFVGSLIACLGVRNYLLTILMIVIHLASLVWYYFSYLPGGTSGLMAMANMMLRGGRSLLPI